LGQQDTESAPAGAIDPTFEIPQPATASAGLAEASFNMLGVLSVQSMGLWACRTTSAMVNAVLDVIPNGPRFKKFAELAYRRDFEYR
jgi:hypothetical protein